MVHSNVRGSVIHTHKPVQLSIFKNWKNLFYMLFFYTKTSSIIKKITSTIGVYITIWRERGIDQTIFAID